MYVGFVHASALGRGRSHKEFILLTLSNDTNNTGYVVYPLISSNGCSESTSEALQFVRQVSDSFELTKPTTTPPAQLSTNDMWV